MKLEVKRLDEGLPLPSRAREGDAGLDLCAAEDQTLKPGERAAIPTGLAVAIPEGCAGLVLPRSGLALRSGMGLVNSPGLIDSGYRGEINVICINHDPFEALDIRRGDRIAQLVVVEVPPTEVVEVEQLPSTARGEAGFGSTG